MRRGTKIEESFAADAIQRLTGANQERLSSDSDGGLRLTKKLVAGQFRILPAWPHHRCDSLAAGEIELAVGRQGTGRIVASQAILPDQLAGLGIEAGRDA